MEDWIDMSQNMEISKEELDEAGVRLKIENEALKKEVENLHSKLLRNETEKLSLSSQVSFIFIIASEIVVPYHKKYFPKLTSMKNREASVGNLSRNSSQSMNSNGANQKGEFNSKTQIEAYVGRDNNDEILIKFHPPN